MNRREFFKPFYIGAAAIAASPFSNANALFPETTPDTERIIYGDGDGRYFIKNMAGERLRAGDVVCLGADGKIYKANSTDTIQIFLVAVHGGRMGRDTMIQIHGEAVVNVGMRA